ncbi:MAG: ParB N-terminal domain-containing protein [Thermodesulfobacteriota bacterium]
MTNGIKIEYVAICQLKPAKYNPRKITEEELEKLKSNIKKFGMVDPIVVNSDLTIIGGHQRFKACVDLGFREMPVVKVDLDKEQEKILNISLNKIKGEWDERKLAEMVSQIKHKFGLAGFSRHEVTKLLKKYSMDVRFLEGEEEPFDAEEEVARITEPRTKPGDLYRLGRHRVLCGDATRKEDVERLLDGQKVDLILSDPPYCAGGFQESGKSAGSVGTDAPHKQIANDRLSTRGYMALLKTAFGNIDASFIYTFTDWRMWVYLFDVIESSGFGVRSMIVWDKGTPGMGRGWRAQHEIIMWGCRITPPFDGHAQGQGNVISEARTGNKYHTTEKPVALIDKLLNNTPFAKTVADPFIGSAPTLISCEKADRICYGMEIDPVHCDVIVARWERYSGKKAKLL